MAALVQASASYVGLASFRLTARNTAATTTASCKFHLLRTVPVAGKSRTLSRNGSRETPTKALGFVGSSITDIRLRDSRLDMLNRGCGGGALGSMCSLPASVETLRWVLVAAATTLLFLKNAAIPKHFLVPLLALELPREALHWMRGEYGLWTAFVALLVKLFYTIPVELKLPLYVLVLVITAPAQITQYRGTTPASLVSLVLAVYLAIEHYRSAGGVEGAFKSDKLLPSLALLLLVIIPILFFANGVM